MKSDELTPVSWTLPDALMTITAGGYLQYVFPHQLVSGTELNSIMKRDYIIGIYPLNEALEVQTATRYKNYEEYQE